MHFPELILATQGSGTSLLHTSKTEKSGVKKVISTDLKFLQTCRNIFKLRNRVRNYEKQLQ